MGERINTHTQKRWHNRHTGIETYRLNWPWDPFNDNSLTNLPYLTNFIFVQIIYSGGAWSGEGSVC